jgi:TnpA family transposase
MMAAFSHVVHLSAKESDDTQLGAQVRVLLDNYGGVERLKEQYKQVSAYHNKNYLPLLWNIHRLFRAALFRLVRLLDIQPTTQDQSLLDALHFIQEHQKARKDYLPYDIDLGFLSGRWRNFVETRHEGKLVLKRRELEVTIFSYVAGGLRRGDLYVPGSQEYADYREQLLPWEECEKRLEEYCLAMEIPNSAKTFVTFLKHQLEQAADHADEFYPENTELTIDETGKPHLKRLRSEPLPQGIDDFLENIRERMPERHLLDILKHVQHWVNYIRHFTSPYGSDPKLKDAVRSYLFTIFGYGCNLGANQTARHTDGAISGRSLRRINQQHITTEKLEAALTDVINEYIRFELPFFWGGGEAMIVDGTHIELVENSLLGERHIRYGGYGGIAYQYISDTYIALFSRFIACGMWEAVYILDGLLKNISNLKPDTIHADTQGQSEPVFGLSFLLGIKLMPRMRNWNDVVFYRPDPDSTYKHIDSLFTKNVNWKLIKTHWKDLMQIVLSIQAGKILPSMLLQKLGVHSRKNKLYQAFRELGRVVRTIFLLQYIGDNSMRRDIQGATAKVETYHNFCDWISFGGKITTSGDPVEQEKRIKDMNLVANVVMLHNLVDLTEVLNQMNAEGNSITPNLVERLSPYMTEHIKRFGQYVLDMEEMPEPMQPQRLTIM